jgi:bifunctional DNA-binding transcriptional regulator/antitoxin component of YhaV-PrlF toxin-antitoxin module
MYLKIVLIGMNQSDNSNVMEGELARMVRRQKMAAEKRKAANTSKWILKLNPKGQTTIPLEVRRALGVGGEIRELELVHSGEDFYLRPHKPPLPIHNYIGYCAEELQGVEDPVSFVRELRGRSAPEEEE